MRDLHIIMAMAGRGSRFANAGLTTPKPLIEVDGQPMFLKALSSLDGISATKHYTIVIRAEHEDQYDLSVLLKHALPTANVVVSHDEPTGAVVDALRAQTFLQPDEGVVVLDCDLQFESISYNMMVEDSLRGVADINGGLLTFTSDNLRYSYAAFDDDGIVTETAEKHVISSHAITGAYYISTAAIFIDTAQKLLSQPLSPEMPEYYLSHLYNILIGEGKKIQATHVDKFASFGTPEELAAYHSIN